MGPASAAEGAKLTRTVITVPEPFVIPAGVGCTFPVAGEAEDVRGTITEFADGRIVTHDIADPTLNDVDTGKSLVHRSRFHVTDWPSSVEGGVVFDTSGQLFMAVFPGDQGPYGLVEYPSLLLSVSGHAGVTMDSSTFVCTSFALNGTATDLCAAFAPE
ncbi:hypothetical protein [Arthrobacter sp. Rue61a]|uniref:hypothetical protein n=1 Tax=Arthrobacter sp. Rue61a TaxID=1118963 RepID=UPI0013922CCF|nr:hypothetical protein [Arthrobacter sp. Rue61a]